MPSSRRHVPLQGITGVLDHSGVVVDIPFVYDSVSHDKHHESFNVNYGFPCAWLDILHGTYYGTYWGKSFIPAYKAGSQAGEKLR